METSAVPKPVPSSDAQADAWFTPGRFALALLVFLGAAYPDVFRGQDTFYFRDFGFFGYPLAFHHRESFWRGELPLWNPLNSCGLPFLAQWNTLVLYPGALFYLLLPLSWSLGFFCLGHLFLAGLGMYWLGYRWTGNRLAAAVAGMAFAFNGLSLNCLMWPNNVAALGWMPLVLLAVERALSVGGRGVVLAALAGAMQMLTGAPEFILFTWAFAAALALVHLARAREARLTPALRFGAIVLLVAGLTAVQLLPFFELLRHSQRSVAFAKSDWPMPAGGWANLLVPMFRCVENRQGVCFQQGQYWTSSYYLGVGVLALAGLSLARIRAWRVWLVVLAGALGLVLALGEDGGLYAWLRAAVPQFGFMRFPIKFIVATIFSLPLLAALGVFWYQTLTVDRLARSWRWLLLGGAVLLALIAGILWFDYRYPIDTRPGDSGTRVGWAETWQSALSRAGLLILILGVLFTLRRVERFRLKVLLRLSLLLLIGLDVLTHAPRQNPTLPRSYFAPYLRQMPNLRLEPLPAHGTSRAMLTPHADTALRYHYTSKPEHDYFFSRLGLFSNCNLLEGIPKVNGFFSLYLRESDTLINALYSTNSRACTGLLDFLGVVQITAADKLVDFEKRETALPLATVGMRPVFTNELAAVPALLSTNFNPRQEVYLPTNAAPFILVTHPTEATILSHRFTTHAAEIRVQAAEPSVLAVAQAYHPAWQASVDDRPVKLWPANLGFQALQVPAGTHTVRLAYVDRSFRMGAALSLGSLATCAVLWMMRRRPTGRAVGSDAESGIASQREAVADSPSASGG